VTVVERAHRLLARTASETMAAWLRTRHEAQGVVFHLGRTAVEIEGKDRKVSAVLLDDGTRIACDAVLSCVGVEPDTGLAVQAGLLHHGPIKVDSARGSVLVSTRSATARAGLSPAMRAMFVSRVCQAP